MGWLLRSSAWLGYLALATGSIKHPHSLFFIKKNQIAFFGAHNFDHRIT
jgi:hypothetical protein